MDTNITIDENYPRIKAWIDIANAQTKAGCPEKAIELLERASDAAKEIDDHAYRYYLLINIANAQTQAGHQEDAIDTLKHALAAANRI